MDNLDVMAFKIDIARLPSVQARRLQNLKNFTTFGMRKKTSGGFNICAEQTNKFLKFHSDKANYPIQLFIPVRV